jgi:phage repressor protein C with HTH and peptisase S24 domain/DNA-binding XRE family transcriptional regulator
MSRKKFSLPTPHERLEAARTKLGLTLRDFAVPLGVSHQAVYKWEKGATPISRPAAKAIEDSYGISRLWLLEGQGEMSVNKDDKDAKERIMTARWRSDMRWHKFFESVGAPYRTFEEWMDAGEYTQPMLEAIERQYLVSPEWLLTGENPMISTKYITDVSTEFEESESQSQFSYKHSAQMEVPVFSTRSYSAGGDTLNDSIQRIDAIPINKDLLEKRLTSRNHGVLFLLEVDWDNMMPTIMPNDLVFVDSHIPSDFPREGIWFLRIDGALCIKRIEHLGPNDYQISNDNAKYPKTTFDDSVQAKGRVVGNFLKRY